MQVKDIMSQPAIVVSEDDTLEQVARTLLENKIGGVPVVDSAGSITGIVTESDFGAKEKSVPFSTFRSANVLGQWLSGHQLDEIYEAARKRQAREIMSKQVKVVSETDPIERAAELLLKYDINRLPVVRGGRPVGMIARRDLVRLMVQNAGD
ncbi:MAG: CBS domain-containing protein [Pyrinomonadaceae bacterium]